MTLRLELPETIRAFVLEQAEAEGCSSPSAYVLALLERTREAKLRAELEAKLLAGVEALDRGEGRPMTSADWERLRADIRTRSGIGD